MGYSLTADAVVILHVGYVAYVVVGQLAIVAGALLRQQWVRNFWFRATHLLAILVVALEAIMGLTCPLTTWENELRQLAGTEARAGSFMGRLFHSLIFIDLPEWCFDIMHVGFGILVLGTFFVVRPRWPQFLSRQPLPPS